MNDRANDPTLNAESAGRMGGSSSLLDEPSGAGPALDGVIWVEASEVMVEAVMRQLHRWQVARSLYVEARQEQRRGGSPTETKHALMEEAGAAVRLAQLVSGWLDPGALGEVR